MSEPQAVSISQAQAIIGLGKTKIYELLKNGEIRAVKCGNRTLILKSELQDFLENLKPYLPESEV